MHSNPTMLFQAWLEQDPVLFQVIELSAALRFDLIFFLPWPHWCLPDRSPSDAH